MTESVRASVTVVNRRGLHARAATKLAQLAGQYQALLTVSSGNRHANAKSIMSLMMLAAAQGHQLELSAEGPDAETALAAVEHLINRGFDEGD